MGQTKELHVSENPADAPRWTPAPWMNRGMAWMLRTPGLQRVVGKSTALMTVTGRNSGDPITFPISYAEVGDHLVATCHRTRQWWRNLEVNPEVEIRLAGVERAGIANVMPDPDNAMAEFLEFLEAQPVVAKMSDIPVDDLGNVDRTRAREVLEYTVVVTIKLEDKD